jgi:adenylate cyclase
MELLIRRALTQKSLARETLDRYREINLLYRVHETIGASVDLDEVIRRVLQEAIHIIQADGGSVLLSNGLVGHLAAYDSVSLDVAGVEERLLGRAFVDKVFQTGKPRILNDLQRLVRPASAEDVQLASLLGAPLKSVDQVLGVIALARTRTGQMFTASDEKLLTALASQAGIALANAREVAARERRLRQQIDALRIEIDEAKKQREVFSITESDFFEELQRNAQRMRAEFDV